MHLEYPKNVWAVTGTLFVLFYLQQDFNNLTTMPLVS